MSKEKPLNLDIIYQRVDSIKFEDCDGKVQIVKEQNHWSQKFFRKLGVKIPPKSYKLLDNYGSFIFRQIDGKKSIQVLGEMLSTEFDEASNQLYERLTAYLEHLEKFEKWIEKVK